MKKIVRNILVVAVMLGAYTSNANNSTKPLINNTHASIGKTISVYDASGSIVFKGQLKTSKSYLDLFDFLQLNNGVYTVELTNAYEVKINAVEIKNGKVTLVRKSESTIFKPVFRTENDKVIISKLALDAKAMKVELYYENELFHTETIQDGKILNRVYRLDPNQSGKYTVIMKTNNRKYVEHFRI